MKHCPCCESLLVAVTKLSNTAAYLRDALIWKNPKFSAVWGQVVAELAPAIEQAAESRIGQSNE